MNAAQIAVIIIFSIFILMLLVWLYFLGLSAVYDNTQYGSTQQKVGKILALVLPIVVGVCIFIIVAQIITNPCNHC